MTANEDGDFYATVTIKHAKEWDSGVINIDVGDMRILHLATPPLHAAGDIAHIPARTRLRYLFTIRAR